MKKIAHLLIISSLFSVLSSGCSGSRKVSGHTNGMLSPCPSSPNCVSSQSNDKKHSIAPITYTEDEAAAENRLVTILTSIKRTNIITRSDGYLHVEFTSLFFRFVWVSANFTLLICYSVPLLSFLNAKIIQCSWFPLVLES